MKKEVEWKAQIGQTLKGFPFAPYQG